MSSDFAMMVALYARGWTVYPWEETAQNMRGRGLPRGEAARKKFRAEFPAYNPEAAFTHNQKEHYGDVVPEEENKIIGPFPDLWEDTTCHGCVWFEEGDPSKPVKIPSKPPPPMDNERYSFPYSKDLVKECTAEERAAAVTKPPRPASPAQIALAAQPPAEPSVPEERQSGPQLPQLRSVYVLHADKNGLPISNDPRPSWLIKADELVLDARKQASGGILMIQPVLMDASGDWGKKKQDRPRWLRAILATNRNHARLWGHAMIIRWQPTMPQLTGWQKAQCGRKTTEKVCTKNNERENFNWEKHLMLQEYLQSPQKFEFVLMLDADAAIVKHRVNVLGQIATRMKADGLDVFLTNEDWLQNGERRINGGLIMSKNTVWTNDLFTDTFDAHLKGPRGLNVWRIGKAAKNNKKQQPKTIKKQHCCLMVVMSNGCYV
ncbi:unnamed protein product [Polarella glacialis]|uniref:Uncharacterized protein n=1 Tax=Polarella glacialis TaxID=89957 RepID=A0A813J3M8_POLGL|nr:unnamed protein product [Polarella glacialis]